MIWARIQIERGQTFVMSGTHFPLNLKCCSECFVDGDKGHDWVRKNYYSQYIKYIMNMCLMVHFVP